MLLATSQDAVVCPCCWRSPVRIELSVYLQWRF